jgi:hypothetical protein
MVSSFLSLLSDDLQILLSLWLDVRSLVTLDTAVTSRTLRPHWMTVLQRLRARAIDDWDHSFSSLIWLSRRGIRTSRLQIKVDAWWKDGSHLSMVDTSELVYIGLRDCWDITDQCVSDLLERYPKLEGLEL